MSNILNDGQTVNTESGVSCKVESMLGGGGQGEVYKVSLGGRPMALKWYFEKTATPAQKMNLQTLIGRGKPNDRFLWPEDIATAPGVPGFGYIMPLRDRNYAGLVDLMTRKISTSFSALATAGIQLSDSFNMLHSMGLCYCDINFGNVFFNPTTGDVLICDNDNVTVDGTPSTIAGTPTFMAPEIVLGNATPSIRTDLYSLGVLLFHMFFLAHPLDGEKEYNIHCKDECALYQLYGKNPIFIFDPNNSSNRPVPGTHDNAIIYWKIYPKFFRDVFTKAFTNGIMEPEHGRVPEFEWRSAMIRLKDSIIYCPCGAQNFYDPEQYKSSGGKAGNCWHCNKELPLPPRIRIGNNIVMLNFDTKLYPHHVDDKRLFDFSKPVAEVFKHPSVPGVWGLKNLTTDRWTMITSDGTTKQVEPGVNALISLGVKINFGKKEGEIRI